MKKYLLTILCNDNVYSVPVSVKLTEEKLWYCFNEADGFMYISIDRNITDIEEAIKVFCEYKYGLYCLGIEADGKIIKKGYHKIAQRVYNNKLYYMLEHNKYGEDDIIITDTDGNIIVNGVYNGFLDLEEHLAYLEEE